MKTTLKELQDSFFTLDNEYAYNMTKEMLESVYCMLEGLENAKK